MKIAILGFGEQGRAALNYWSGAGNEITIRDLNAEVSIPNNVNKQLGENYLSNLRDFDLIVRSPSVHPNDIARANESGILAKVTTVTNEFFRICPSKNIIAVTGTKGKGTTSTLIAKMLEADGKKVHLGGNIGTPPLDMLNPPSGGSIKPDDWVVLELANFQLIDIKYSPHIAVCLMVVSEHMDWHKDMEEYISAKQQLFIHQTAQDIAVYYANNEYSKRIAFSSQGQTIPYMEPPGAVVDNGFIKIDGQAVCQTSELKLLGAHNWQNICAAVTAVWQITQNVAAIKQVLTSFSGLEHRLELVRELDGIKYYDDSFGTTPETAIVAIEAFSKPKVVILGGSDKGSSYDELAKTIAENNVKSAVLIGQMAPKIQAALKKVGFNSCVDGGKTMPEIVNTARRHASLNSVVLLSTACASFDMFKNYKDRGEQFKSAVQALV